MRVEVVRAEAARFRYPLLFIHGLWTGGWIWRDIAGYFAHRGWDTWLPSFLDDGPPEDLDQRVERLVDLSRSLPGPPIVIAHDAGKTTALALAEKVRVPAIVALAPVLASSGHLGGVFSGPMFWTARLFASQVSPPRGRIAGRVLAGLDDLREDLKPDAGAFFRATLARRASRALEWRGAGLLVCSPDDPVASVSEGEELAARMEWSFDVHETAGHFPMCAPGWDRLADRLHRWIVQSLGSDLLVWLDDDAGDGER